MLFRAIVRVGSRAPRLVFGRDVRDIEMCSETDFGPTDYLEVVYGKESAEASKVLTQRRG